MTPLDALLEMLPRWTLVGGKGGVGKTTCAAALASALAQRAESTLLISTDPARSLGDALGVPIGAKARPIPGRPGLEAFQLDAATEREAFLSRWRDVLVTIVDRGTYLDVEDIAGLIDSALPGADEAMALLTLAEVERESRWTRIIVDTAPTGHTLRLLSLPDTFRALIELLDLMQGKHRFMVWALTHDYRPDAADAFLAEMRQRLDGLAEVLRDPRRTAVVLVARPEPVVAAETVRFLDALPGLGLSAATLVVNAIPSHRSAEVVEALEDLAAAAAERKIATTGVRLLDEPPIGLDAIDAWGAAVGSVELRREIAPTGARTQTTSHNARDWLASLPPAHLVVRSLTIVGGKGGVGKTTVACALAIRSASAAKRVLVVSTDPAPSVADALLQPVGDDEVAVVGVEGVYARQMDAAAALERFRTGYVARIDALFDALIARGVDASHDRRILRDLLALAPPGIDELYALASLGETLDRAQYSAIIVDPAPTGHLLRLLEMPALALDWAHRLMRVMLKYRELASFGDVGEELLAFARRTRALGELLRDSERSGLLVVALDEPLVRAETIRLIEAAGVRGIAVTGVLWNRALRLPAPLTAGMAVTQFVGEPVEPPPRGVDALRTWSATWRAVPREHV